MSISIGIGMSTEREFLMNLKHLCGSTNAVTVDYVLGAVSYINQHCIEECQFIVEEYTRVISNNDSFLEIANLPIFSVPLLVELYRQARDNPSQNRELLKELRSIHRQARSFLDDPKVKERIELIATNRKQSMVFQQYLNVVDTITGFARDSVDLDCRVVNKLTEILSQLTQQIPLIKLPNEHSVVAARNPDT